MAKVFGPVLSITARKSIGKTITFQRRPSGTAVIKPPRPSRRSLDQPSEAKQIQRDKIGDAVSVWQSLSESIKALYNESAAGSERSGYHLFMYEYLKGYPIYSFGDYAVLGELILGVAVFGKQP